LGRVTSAVYLYPNWVKVFGFRAANHAPRAQEKLSGVTVKVMPPGTSLSCSWQVALGSGLAVTVPPVRSL